MLSVFSFPDSSPKHLSLPLLLPLLFSFHIFSFSRLFLFLSFSPASPSFFILYLFVMYFLPSQFSPATFLPTCFTLFWIGFPHAQVPASPLCSHFHLFYFTLSSSTPLLHHHGLPLHLTSSSCRFPPAFIFSSPPPSLHDLLCQRGTGGSPLLCHSVASCLKQRAIERLWPMSAPCLSGLWHVTDGRRRSRGKWERRRRRDPTEGCDFEGEKESSRCFSRKHLYRRTHALKDKSRWDISVPTAASHHFRSSQSLCCVSQAGTCCFSTWKNLEKLKMSSLRLRVRAIGQVCERMQGIWLNCFLCSQSSTQKTHMHLNKSSRLKKGKLVCNYIQ